MKKTWGIVFFALFVSLIASGCAEEKQPPVKPITQAALLSQKIDQGGLHLDVSKTEDVIAFMNRTPDNIERAPDGINRLITYNFPDQSKIVFAMKPVGTTEGLVLNYYMAKDK